MHGSVPRWREIMQTTNFARYLGMASVFLLVFLVVQYRLVAGNSFLIIPVHQDDYLLLGSSLNQFQFWTVRPVSTFAVKLMGTLGVTFSSSLMVFLSLAVSFLWLIFASRYVRQPLSWIGVALAATIVWTHSSAYEHTKYLGLITNLVSSYFGLLAIILMLGGRRSSWYRMVLVVECYAASVFAKEDFLAPPLIMSALLVLREFLARRDRGQVRKALPLFGVLLGVATLSLIYDFWLVKDAFVVGLVQQSGETDPYRTARSLSQLWAGVWKLTVEYDYLPTAVSLIAYLYLIYRSSSRRLEVLGLGLMWVCLVLTYAMIPNHILPYRVFVFLPVQAAIISLGVLALADDVKTRMAKISSQMVAGVGALALIWLFATQSLTETRYVALWYQHAQRVNSQYIASLQKNRDALARDPVVAVLGLNGLSPWSNGGDVYLRSKWRFDNKWIVLVGQDSMFYKVDTQYLPSRPTNILLESTMCSDFRGMPAISFDQNGTGTLGRLCETADVGQ